MDDKNVSEKSSRVSQTGSLASPRDRAAPLPAPRHALTPTASPLRLSNLSRCASPARMSADGAQGTHAVLREEQAKPAKPVSPRVFSHTASAHDPEVWAPPLSHSRLPSGNLSSDGGRPWSGRDPGSGTASFWTSIRNGYPKFQGWLQIDSNWYFLGTT